MKRLILAYLANDAAVAATLVFIAVASISADYLNFLIATGS